MPERFDHLRIKVAAGEADDLGASLVDWPPFFVGADTYESVEDVGYCQQQTDARVSIRSPTLAMG